MSSSQRLGKHSQSLASINSQLRLAHGHGYMIPKKRVEKAYFINFKDRMNRTHRGPGGKFLWYAFACFWASLVWFSAGAVFLGHRNVSRMIVYRAEVFGPLMVVGGILCVGMMGHYCYKARKASNEWRSHIYVSNSYSKEKRYVNMCYYYLLLLYRHVIHIYVSNTYICQ